MGMSRCPIRKNPAKWLIGKTYTFRFGAWWDGQGTGDSGSTVAFISLVGLSSITLNIAATGYATNGFYYEFYDEDNNILGTRQTASGTLTFDVADAAYMRYYSGGSAPGGGRRTITVDIQITDAIAY